MVRKAIPSFFYHISQVAFGIIKKAFKIEVVKKDNSYYGSQSQEIPGPFNRP